MDGFGSENAFVIVLAVMNCFEILDLVLMCLGRFDR